MIDSFEFVQKTLNENDEQLAASKVLSFSESLLANKETLMVMMDFVFSVAFDPKRNMVSLVLAAIHK
jgi:hypothetical protein